MLCNTCRFERPGKRMMLFYFIHFGKPSNTELIFSTDNFRFLNNKWFEKYKLLQGIRRNHITTCVGKERISETALSIALGNKFEVLGFEVNIDN